MILNNISFRFKQLNYNLSEFEQWIYIKHNLSAIYK